MLAGIDYKSVFNTGKNVGHVVIITGMNKANDQIDVIDPSGDGDGLASISIQSLIKGMMDKSDGFWVIGEPPLEPFTLSATD